MRNRLRALVVFSALACSPSASTPGPRLPPAVDAAIAGITSDELRAHVEALAGDSMGGRAVGQEGNRRAEEYVARVLQRATAASFAGTYFQPVELYRATLGDDARLTIGGGSGGPLLDLEAGASFYPRRESGDSPVTGPLVAAGHGISAPSFHHDDYAHRNVNGAVVLVDEGVPESLRHHPGISSAEHNELSTVRRKVGDARAHGAIGVIVVEPSMPDAQTVWAAPANARDVTYRLFSSLAADPVAVAVLSGHEAARVRRALSRRTRLTATIRPGIRIHRLMVHNVIAAVDPPDPAPRELVVVGAHLDHDGVDADGRIFNGADDNASGTSAVLAVAGALTRAASRGQRPRRRIVFALWNAEERGSLGAEAYLASPVPAGRIVANLNLDMVGRDEDIPDPDDPRFRGFRRTSARANANTVHLLGYSFSPDLAALARRANETIGLTLRREYDHDAQNLVQRSDNWPFLKRGIPALFLTTGLHPDYHTPDDDADRIDFAKLERIAELTARLTWLAADGQPVRFRRQP